MKCKQTRAIKRLMPLLLILVLIVPSISQVAYAAGFSAIVTSDSMPVYSDLEMNNPIGVLSKGTIVVVYRYAGNVAAIACPTNGAAGIARVSDMVAVASIAKKAVVSVSGAKVYQEASASSASGDLKKGTKLYVLAINGEWAMVESGSGVVGYMYTSQLYIEGMTTSPDPTPTVAPPVNRTHNGREGRGCRGLRCARLSKGECLQPFPCAGEGLCLVCRRDQRKLGDGAQRKQHRLYAGEPVVHTRGVHFDA